ncbi:MAG: ABC transporter ATP-binding protein [Planctomycetes bacterium]|nr:ABC transporter ATP-binding protein [Planctomycetota bacterium]
MTSSDKIIIRCKDVRKSYGSGDTRVQALRGVDLEVREGEMLMLVGPSGCGKTTLISILAGTLDADGGECNVLGSDLRALGAREKTQFRARSIGFVFQTFNLLPTLTAVENTAVPLLIRGVARAKAFDRAKELLNQVGLGGRERALPSQLSGGQQQRVAIARSLVHDPALIVCDEPTSALDHDTGARIMSIFRDVALAAHRTLVIVTHDNRIFNYGDRIARMDDGIIMEVRENEALAAAS